MRDPGSPAVCRTKGVNHLFEATSKLREDFANIPCVFCKETTKTPEDDYRVCTICMKEHPNYTSLIAGEVEPY